MADITGTASLTPTIDDPRKEEGLVLDLEKLFQGAALSWADFLHDIAAQRGRIKNFDGSQGELPLAPAEISEGAARVPTDADYSLTGEEGAVGDAKWQAQYNVQPWVHTRVTVAGVASDADASRLVYLADTNNYQADLTLTNANGQPVGVILAVNTDLTCRVLFFGMALQYLMAKCGYGFGVLPLGLLNLSTPAGATGCGTPVMPFRGLLLACEAQVTQAAATVGDAVFELRVNGVAVATVAANARITVPGGSVVGATFSTAVDPIAESVLAVFGRGERITIQQITPATSGFAAVWATYLTLGG